MSRVYDSVAHLLGCTDTHTPSHLPDLSSFVPKLRKVGLEHFINPLKVCDAEWNEAAGTKSQRSFFFLLLLRFVMAFLFFSRFMFGMAVLAAPLFCILLRTAAAGAA